MSPQVWNALMRVLRPDLDFEVRRREVMIGLMFVSLGMAVRKFYEMPDLTREDGATLVRAVREHLEGM